MEARAIIASTTVALLLMQISCAVAMPARETASNVFSRQRRKIGLLNITGTPAEEFMKQMYLSVADEDGRPRDGTEDPAAVWCLMDEDISQGTYREKLSSSGKCMSVKRFVVSWESLSEKFDNRPALNATFRTHMQVIPRFITDRETEITVNTSMRYVTSDVPKLSSSNDSSNSTEERDMIFAGSQQMNVTEDSNKWVELDISAGVKALWPPQKSLVEVIIQIGVNCRDQKKVPVDFISPAEIPLDQPNRRVRHLSFQPLMVINLNDEAAKQKLHAVADEDIPGPTIDGGVYGDINDTTEGEKRRRRASGGCRLQNFSVIFAEMNLNNILTPKVYNIKKCAGSCSIHHITRNPRTTSNHAKLIAAAALVYNDETKPAVPCCVPIKYKSAYLLIQYHSSIEMRLFPEFKADKCGCR